MRKLYMSILLIISTFAHILAVPNEANIKMSPEGNHCFTESNKAKVTWSKTFKEEFNAQWPWPTTWTAINGLGPSGNSSIHVTGLDVQPIIDAATGEYTINFPKPGVYKVNVTIWYKADRTTLPLYANESFTKTFNIAFYKVTKFEPLPEKKVILKDSTLNKEDFIIESEPNSIVNMFEWSKDSTDIVGTRKAYLKLSGKTCSETEFTVVEVKLKSVSFSGDKYHEVKNDSNTTSYSAPHWLDANTDGTPEKKHPIAYTRNVKAKVSAEFVLNPAVTSVDFFVEASSSGVNIPSTKCDIAGDLLKMPITESNTNFINEIDYVDTFDLKWKIKCGSSSLVDIGTSKNKLYITLADPISSLRQETLFDVGCRNGDGQTTDAGAVPAIFGEFIDLSVKCIDGAVLTYWGGISSSATLSTNFFNTSGLLLNGDGRCGAWAEFLKDIYEVQGIAGSSVKSIDTISKGGLTGAGFYVKNWDLTVNPPVDLTGIAGQNNPDPESRFVNHAVVKYGGKLYDPSYGAEFSDLAKWEDSAIAIFIYTNAAGDTFAAVNNPSPSEESKLTP